MQQSGRTGGIVTSVRMAVIGAADVRGGGAYPQTPFEWLMAKLEMTPSPYSFGASPFAVLVCR